MWSGELLNFIEKDKYNTETFDIDPKIKVSETRDTILNPPSYQDKYILTNPPYLAGNKCKEKKLIEPFVSLKVQKKIVERRNKMLNEHCEKYHSLFLTNYRESKDIARKRISFDLVYRIVEHVLDEIH